MFREFKVLKLEVSDTFSNCSVENDDGFDVEFNLKRFFGVVKVLFRLG